MTATAWQGHARRLADTLAERGDLRTPQWHAAVAAVPRHQLVPHAYRQDPTGEWAAFDTADEPELVYSPTTLITALESTGDHRRPVSSSTKPDLMVRMLEILDVQDGHRLLEIGTGTGYNAALLAHRLGDDHVFTVDLDGALVDLARERLATVGHHPTVVAVDGAGGLPEHAPYDRIIATCSVPAIPWVWAEQLAPDGSILVDLKLTTSAGNLVHLHRVGDDTLQGNFTRRWAAFMAMRSGPAPAPVPRAEAADNPVTRTTTAPAAPWNDATVAWFLAQLRLPVDVTFGYVLDETTRQPAASTLSAPDGSWARISLTDGTVTEAGSTSLWASVEWAHDQWTTAGRPTWERLGLTATRDGGHEVWMDTPSSPRRWSIRRR